jgi:hypothetical protein
MNVFDLHPKGTNVVLFTDAYGLHIAAGETYRLANRIPPQGEPPATTQQRKAILTIAAQLLTKRRDEVLDEFSRSWLLSRDLPIPKHEQSQGTSDVGSERTSPPEAEVPRADRGSLSDAASHDRSHQESTGESLP